MSETPVSYEIPSETSDGIESWRPVPSYEDYYEVSDYGRVRRLRAARGTQGSILNGSLDCCGYRRVSLWKHNRGKTVRIHRLVTAAFLGSPGDREPNHIDGDKTNNRLSNLEYVTRSENLRHSYRLGMHRRSRNHKFDSGLVATIRRLAKALPQREIARRLGVSASGVNMIVNGRRHA